MRRIELCAQDLGPALCYTARSGDVVHASGQLEPWGLGVTFAVDDARDELSRGGITQFGYKGHLSGGERIRPHDAGLRGFRRVDVEVANVCVDSQHVLSRGI